MIVMNADVKKFVRFYDNEFGKKIACAISIAGNLMISR
jgi:hypothetical protein